MPSSSRIHPARDKRHKSEPTAEMTGLAESSVGGDGTQRGALWLTTVVQVIAVTSAVLPIMGAIRAYTAAVIDGLPNVAFWQTSVARWAYAGFDTVGAPTIGLSGVLLLGWATPHLLDRVWPRALEGLGGLTLGLVMVAVAVLLWFSLTGPFPLVLTWVALYAPLSGWFGMLAATAALDGKAIPFRTVAVAVTAAAAATSVAAGITGGRWDAAYVWFSPESPHSSGWYFELSSNTDSVYLWTCPDKRLIEVPWSTVTSIDYQTQAPDIDTSLLHALQTGSLPPFGDVFTCPSDQSAP
jgi:hypothetical protein